MFKDTNVMGTAPNYKIFMKLPTLKFTLSKRLGLGQSALNFLIASRLMLLYVFVHSERMCGGFAG